MAAAIQKAVLQRKGKGGSAKGIQAKPPNPIKKPTFKTANVRRVPLTELLGLATRNTSHYSQITSPGFSEPGKLPAHMCNVIDDFTNETNRMLLDLIDELVINKLSIR